MKYISFAKHFPSYITLLNLDIYLIYLYLSDYIKCPAYVQLMSEIGHIRIHFVIAILLLSYYFIYFFSFLFIIILDISIILLSFSIGANILLGVLK